MSRGQIIIGLVGMLATLVPAQTARAQCQPATPSVVWSYPAAGQQDVPTNARVWLLTSFGRQPQAVSIDGVTVRQSGVDFSYAPDQPFTPGAAHQVTITYPGFAPLIIAFTTGAGPADPGPPDKPITHWATPLSTRSLTGPCQAALSAMSCFNAGEDTHLVFATEGTPLAWLIERVPGADTDPRELHLWPTECGLPEIFARAADTRVCGRDFRLHALGPTGLRTMGDRFCAANLLKTVASGAASAPSGTGAPPPDAGVGADAQFLPLVRGEPSAPAAGGASRSAGATATVGCSVIGGAQGIGSLGLLVGVLVVRAARRRRRS